MSNTAESAMARLWRDRVQRREQERNEAQTRACVAEERLAALTAETERLARENALVRAQNDRLAVTVARLTAEKERLAADLAGLREQRAAAPARAEPSPYRTWERSGPNCCPCWMTRAGAAFIDIAPNAARVVAVATLRLTPLERRDGMA